MKYHMNYNTRYVTYAVGEVAAMGILTLYHGAKDVVSAPTLGKAHPHKDFGPGFYVTPH